MGQAQAVPIYRLRSSVSSSALRFGVVVRVSCVLTLSAYATGLAYEAMVGPRVAVSVLAFTAHAGAFRFPQVNNVIQNGKINTHTSHLGSAGTQQQHARHSCRRPRASTTAVSMVSEREEELKDKIAKLRGAASKGDTYERVVGKGSELKDKMEKSKGEFDGTVDRERQVSYHTTAVLLYCCTIQSTAVLYGQGPVSGTCCCTV